MNAGGRQFSLKNQDVIAHPAEGHIFLTQRKTLFIYQFLYLDFGNLKFNAKKKLVEIPYQKVDTCFVWWLRRNKETSKRETRFSGHRDIFKTKIDYSFGTLSQSSTPFQFLKSNINIVCRIDEKLVSRAFDIEISKEDIGAKKADCLINDINSICNKFCIKKGKVCVAKNLV